MQAEVANLAKVIASGEHSPTVIEAITEREREISEISDRLTSSSPDSIRSHMRKLRTKALTRVKDLRDCLNGDPVAARAYLTRHVEKIEMEPSGKRYIASGDWNLLGEGRWDGAEGQS